MPGAPRSASGRSADGEHGVVVHPIHRHRDGVGPRDRRRRPVARVRDRVGESHDLARARLQVVELIGVEGQVLPDERLARQRPSEVCVRPPIIRLPGWSRCPSRRPSQRDRERATSSFVDTARGVTTARRSPPRRERHRGAAGERVRLVLDREAERAGAVEVSRRLEGEVTAQICAAVNVALALMSTVELHRAGHTPAAP